MSSILRLPGPATRYCRFVPVTCQFVTAAANSLRAKLPNCKSADHVQRSFRTLVVITVFPNSSFRLLKSRVTRHRSGDVPPWNMAHDGDHAPVPLFGLYTHPYTPTRFPFAPGAPPQISRVRCAGPESGA